MQHGQGYSNANPYLAGLVANYGAQATVNPHMLGVPQAPAQAPERRVRLIPLAGSSSDQVQEFFYVDARRYERILRRREIRARKIAENRHVRSGKPYLHESRHLHALGRKRGHGGRFLNTKAAKEESASTSGDSEGHQTTPEGQSDFHASHSRQAVMDSIHGLQDRELPSMASPAIPSLQQMQYHPGLLSQGPIGMFSGGNPGGRY